MNPLLVKFDTPFQSIPFSKIKNEHYLPAFKESISIAKNSVEKIKMSEGKPTFDSVIAKIDEMDDLTSRVSALFFNLTYAKTDDELQKIAVDFSSLLSEFSNDVVLDSKLFGLIKEVYENRDSESLNLEQLTYLDKTYKFFIRNGALLSEGDKLKLRELDKEVTKLSLEFGENVLADINDFKLHLTEKDDLSGLPESVIEAASAAAKDSGIDSGWLFTLHFPSCMPFLKYSSKRELREKIYKAFNSKCYKKDKFDNREITKKIAKLRYERALLLGYESHAHFIQEERMAKNPATVEKFLDDLLQKAKPIAEKEMGELKEFARNLDGNFEFQSWDYNYYAEKLKKERYSIDDELLRPYLKLENVIEGVFNVANKLYGIKFVERADIDKYHEDVRVFEVLDEFEKHVGLLYTDFFPRASKKSGAWMTSFQEQAIRDGKDLRPHASVVCNFTKPVGNKPSLLTFNEVKTLFHEFGHALHGLMSNCIYRGVSGTNVPWDFVELPSQLMENWVNEKECLDLFAKHFETGEKIDEDIIKRIKKSSSFHEGRNTVRQLSFAILDMGWHKEDPSYITDIEKFEEKVRASTELLPVVEGVNTSCSFAHVFQGGYSAGYYSYKWAEVLEADAFELFKEKGIFNSDVSKSFLNEILSKGGSEHPSILYKRFRGREATVDALLNRMNQ